MTRKRPVYVYYESHKVGDTLRTYFRQSPWNSSEKWDGTAWVFTFTQPFINYIDEVLSEGAVVRKLSTEEVTHLMNSGWRAPCAD